MTNKRARAGWRMPRKKHAETDEEYCRRAFHDQDFKCARCSNTIKWPGLCGSCVDVDLAAAGDRMTVEKILGRFGVPTKVRDCNWKRFDVDGFDRELVLKLDKARDWRGTVGPWCLVLTGPPGVGKSHIAVATLRRFVEEGRKVAGGMFRPEDVLLSEMRAEYDGVETDVVKAAMECELLVVDDLGSTRVTDWSASQLVSILNRRESEGRGTVVTTNLTLNDLAAMMDERLASRLAAGLVVKFPANLPDYRMKDRG